MSEQSIAEEMFRSGVQYGYAKSRRHPSTTPYIFTTKNGVDIIDIEKTQGLLDNALEYIKTLGASNKTILFVGTKPEASQQVVEVALSLGMPYVSERWVGGTITNFAEIKKRIAKLLELREQKENGGLDKYTKKEKILIDKEMKNMDSNFQGLVGMTRTPDVVFIVDPKKEHMAVMEAKKTEIPVVSVLNTDCNMKQIQYPILANDASISSISFFLTKIKEAYTEGTKGITK